MELFKILTERLSGEHSAAMAAKGIAGHILCTMGIQSEEQLFEEYLEKRRREYVLEHEGDTDAWERNLGEEFLMRRHLPDEREAAEEWEPVLAGSLCPDEADSVRSIIYRYKKFVYRRQLLLTPHRFPEGREIEETFLDEFRSDEGVASSCLFWIDALYVRTPKTEKGKREWNRRFEEELIRIRARNDLFDESVLNHTYSSLMKEIGQHLQACPTHEERVRYIIGLLIPLTKFSNVFYPKDEIEMEENEIRKAQKVGCEEWTRIHQEKIDFLKERSRRFRQWAQEGQTRYVNHKGEPDIFMMLGRWWHLTELFARKLAALALTCHIDLRDVQEQCAIYIFEYRDISDFVDNQSISKKTHARRLLLEIEARKQEAGTWHKAFDADGDVRGAQYVVHRVENGGQGIVINYNYYTHHEALTSPAMVTQAEAAKVAATDETPCGASPETGTELPTGDEIEKNHIIKKCDHFIEMVKRYDFFESPKVKCLTKEQRGELVRAIICKNDAYGAYAIAMLCYLQYDKWMKDNYAKDYPDARRSLTKEAIFCHWKEALSLNSKRAVAGNYNVIRVENSSEDKEKYKSWLFTSIVIEDYNKIIGQ